MKSILHPSVNVSDIRSGVYRMIVRYSWARIDRFTHELWTADGQTPVVGPSLEV